VGVQCVILAGGLGTRMRPLTDRIPKALLPVNGVPFVDHQLRWLASHGVDEAVLCIGHRGGQIRTHLGGGERFGLSLRYVDEGENLRGTGGALRLALDEGALADSFLVTYGDSYLPVDFGEVARAFERSGASAMMAVFRNRGRWDRSNAAVDGDRVALYDKRRRGGAAPRMEYIDYGLSALKRKVVQARIPPGAVVELADLFHQLSLEGGLAAYQVAVRFYEVGSPQGVADLEHFLLE
jgi:NDP-sugar pyrophosphorylase family protein